jgi:hypothetical protein
MLIHISSLILLLAVGVSCAPMQDKMAPINLPKEIHVAEFLNVSPESNVLTACLSDTYGNYILIYSQDLQKGVVIDFEKNTTDARPLVRNVGFGTHLRTGQWNLYHEDNNGTRYESEGGQWTFQHFDFLLTKGLKQKKISTPLKCLVQKSN